MFDSQSIVISVVTLKRVEFPKKLTSYISKWMPRPCLSLNCCMLSLFSDISIFCWFWYNQILYQNYKIMMKWCKDTKNTRLIKTKKERRCEEDHQKPAVKKQNKDNTTVKGNRKEQTENIFTDHYTTSRRLRNTNHIHEARCDINCSGRIKNSAHLVTTVIFFIYINIIRSIMSALYGLSVQRVLLEQQLFQ